MEAPSALQVCVPVDTLADPVVAGSRYDVCGCGVKLVPVLTTRLVFAGSETMRDWSVLLELVDGRVMSAVA